ncbi:unnamed protein product [Spirodela intermedia]|uniref:CCHC-type domain-containing protein n=1 Tax=Spirodela intermedia TaxID=51605 RepID=A0A7I8LFA0_SPIIN|nr:unnamed protein product [Spirodela intermedia]
MASEDFIDLGSDPGNDADEVDDQASESAEVHQISDDPSVDYTETAEACEGEIDQETFHVVNIEDNSIQQSSVLQKGVDWEETVTVVEELTVAGPEPMENGSIDTSPPRDHTPEPSCILLPAVTGAKRSRTPGDEQPSVHVVYKSLSQASRRKLEELLQEWSEWHGRSGTSSDASSMEAMEDGEQTYFPALRADPDKPSSVSFRVDKRARTDESGSVDGDWVPLYDRGFTLGLSATDGSARPERVEPLEASRCFNCGSYSHSLKDCPRPRDSAAINLARRQHSSRRNSASGQRGQTRYYQISTGKFDGLRAGVLGPELRESLGIGELDPPPWLHRMRELGYPPGYLEEEEDEDPPSGITIYAEEEGQLEYEEGELPEKGEPGPSEKKMTVEFPGINAPIPEKADRRLWAVPGGLSAGSGRRSEMQREFSDQRRPWDYRDGGGPSSSSPAPLRRSPSGYSSYDHHSLSRTPRSLSERERGPLSYEGSPYSSGHSLYSGEIYGRTAHSDRWYGGAAAEDSPPRRDRLRHRHHHHHHQR